MEEIVPLIQLENGIEIDGKEHLVIFDEADVQGGGIVKTGKRKGIRP